VISRSFCFLFL